MNILVDEIAHPFVNEDTCISGQFSLAGKPQPTGKWAMKGDELYVELAFTYKSLFCKSKQQTRFIHESHIKLEADMVYFNCKNEIH